MTLSYHHVDVFARHPYRGNSLAVFPDDAGLTSHQMNRITKELRHFESIFLSTIDARTVRARIFDLVEELDFAGHPLLGAAATLHALNSTSANEEWTFVLNARTVKVRTSAAAVSRYETVLEQGHADFLDMPLRQRSGDLAAWFGLDTSDLDSSHQPEVVSTGLRYLVLPVRADALERSRISVADLHTRLNELGAQYAYLLNIAELEGRHWNNDGVVEDVATGSAAGCVAAYLRRHQVIGDGERAVLRQGRFTGRPSEMTIRASGRGSAIHSVEVGGVATIIGGGYLDLLPEA